MTSTLDWQKEALLQEMESLEEVRELLEVFLRSAEDLSTEIKRALEEGDLSKAREKAHALKGACATIFFERARVLAYDLEKAPDLECARSLFDTLENLLQSFKEEVKLQISG